MTDVPRLRSTPRWLWLATLPPAAALAVLIANNAVDVLFMDDWSLVGETLIQAGSGQLDLAHLIRQHNESRPFFPRLLFLAIGTVTQGDFRWLLLLTFTLACLVSYSVFFLARATVTRRVWYLWGLTFLANLLIFTPKPAKMWLMGSYVGLEPIACLTASLAVLHSRLSPGRKVAIGAALCTVATFSYANGLSLWLLVAPVLLLSVGPRWLGWWALGLLLNAGLYFHGYVTPAHHPSLLDGMQPLRLGHFVLAFLGASMGLNRLAIATAVGAVFLAVFALLGVYLLMHAREEDLRRRVAPWLSIGGYALLSGLATGLGRSAFGVRSSLANRYIPFSLYLGLALLFLVPIGLQHARARGLFRPTPRRSVQVFLAICLAACSLLHASSAAIGVREMASARRMLRNGKSCLLFINVLFDQKCLSHLYPRPEDLRPRANGLDQLGYLRPGLVESRRLQDIQACSPAVRYPGVFETFSSRPGAAAFVARGWASLPTNAGPADAVILARQEPGGDWVLLEFAAILELRQDVSATRGRAYRNAGWSKRVFKRTLPPRPFQISAWSFDAERGCALPLDGIYTARARAETRP